MTLCLLFVQSVSFAQDETQENAYQLDLLGDTHWSKYNFTDLVSPYEGIDTWLEIRNTLWLDNKQQKVGLYGGLMFTNMFYPNNPNGLIFGWQRHLQLGGGLQFYPFYQKPEPWETRLPGGGYKPLFGLRFYLWAGHRIYYGQPPNHARDNQTFDIQIGADYYYENITTNNILTLVAWSNAGFRNTNFSNNSYRALLWTGNLRFGPKWPTEVLGNLFFNLSTDWTITSQCKCRWWENYLRLAGGVSWYPFINKSGSFWDFFRRMNFYIDGYFHNSWLGEDPNSYPDLLHEVSQRDLRFGVSFATPNLFRKQQ
jgi:hypothetical protein